MFRFSIFTVRGIVFESFRVNFFSVAGVTEGSAADDVSDSVADVLVSGSAVASSEEEAPPNIPFSFPEKRKIMRHKE